MSLELLIVIGVVVAIVVVGLVVVSLTTGSTPVAPPRRGYDQRPGPFAGAMAVIDRSIAMYVLRRLTGRPTSLPPGDRRSATALTSDEIAHRIGASSAPAPARHAAFGPGVSAGAASSRGTDPGGDTPGRWSAPSPATVSSARRSQRVRDVGVALAGLAAVALVAVLVWPGGMGRPTGGVLGIRRANVTARPSAIAEASATSTNVKDATKPAVTAPLERFSTQTVGSSTMKVHLSWSGSDAGNGIAKYELQVSANGGPYTTVVLPRATSTSVERTLADERSYRYRVRATDRQGNVGAYVYGPRFKPGRIQNTSSSVSYRGVWRTVSASGALGGSHRSASLPSARASITRTMRDVAWIGTKTSDSGSAQVWIDGALAATINLHSTSTTYRQLVFHRHFSTLASHRIEIRPIGGGRIDLDAFLLMR